MRALTTSATCGPSAPERSCAFRALTEHPVPASRGRKSPPTGELLVMQPRHSLLPQGHSLFKVGQRELAFKGPDRRVQVRGKDVRQSQWEYGCLSGTIRVCFEGLVSGIFSRKFPVIEERMSILETSCYALFSLCLDCLEQGLAHNRHSV